MIKILANSLVIVGACVLIGALIPVRKLIAQLPSGPVRRDWYELTILIIVLIIGYLTYTVAFWNSDAGWLDFIVPSVFLFGAVFVWLTTSLSLQTAFDVRRVTLLEQESITDALTGIYNRRYMEKRLKEEISRAKRYNLPLSVLLLDIDRFKQINDTHGHQVGDSLLNHLSNLLLNATRDSDVLARYGGDELFIIALNTTGASAALLAERLRRDVEDTRLIVPREADENLEIQVTVSVGITEFKNDIDDTETLVKQADEALYRAKQGGRNRVVIHDGGAAGSVDDSTPADYAPDTEPS